MTRLPLLLPQSAIPQSLSEPHLDWRPNKYLNDPQPPPVDDVKLQEQELASQRLGFDGKMLKKTRPRRTVDYNGGMGRWRLLRQSRPNSRYVPYLRPSPAHIIDLLPPKAYLDNPSTSLCTKYVHTSTNKIRCPVNCVTWTPEARRVLTGSTSGEFTLWNGLTFNFETILQAHDTAICAFEFSHSGAYLASTDKSGVIKYFEPNMNNLTAWQGSNSREAIRGISFSPDDRRFATASDDSSVRIWSFHESRAESVLKGHNWDVKCVRWHPTKGLLVSGSKDNQVKFWDPRTGTCLSTLYHHKNTIQALAWSPNGNQVASASRDQTVRVFDIRAMKEFRILKGHKKEVCSVTWHPLHPILVSGGSEGDVLHWDLSALIEQTPTIAPRAALPEAHESNVWALAFHPLGHILVTGSNDHTTRFWSRERPAGDMSTAQPPPDAQEEQDDDDHTAVPGLFGAGPMLFRSTGSGMDDGTADDSHDDAYKEEPSQDNNDFIPGFGGSSSSATARSNDVPPPPRDPYRQGDWNGRGHSGNGQWQSRRGGRGGGQKSWG
ncbi:WD40 repeat-like protein [Fistulina hepatica ATCC 64428]|nr:WD40 repeat-like protein [Fistulina hepatica ATCC 64428]